MLPQESPNTVPGPGAPATLHGNFSTDEVNRLVELRRAVHNQEEYLKRMLDERRLEFARWLLDNGKLTEACADL